MEENTNNVVKTQEEKQETKTYTQEEVMALLQSEADKRVQQALKKQQKKYEKQLSLSGLDEQQRATAEKDMRIAELEEKLKEFNIIQNRAEISKVLTARGLDVRFADVIDISDDIEDAQEKIETLDKLFKAAVKAEVEKRIGGSTPKTGTTGLDGAVTKEDFRKMSLSQQAELYRNNKELYEKLKG